MHVAPLVPRRPGDGRRDETWTWVARWWSEAFHGHLEPVVGLHLDGPFNRAAALNTAADAAGAWDVAVIADADCIADPANITAAVNHAAATGAMVTAYDRFAHLTKTMSTAILNGYTGWWEPGIDWTLNVACSSMVAVPRRLWDKTGGFDERFAGWGMEDIAFFHAATTFGGPLARIAGTVWHLWHPPARNTSDGAAANEALMHRYAAASGNPTAMRLLIAERQGVAA